MALTADIKKQQNLINETKAKIQAMKDKEAKRILRLADKAGYFEVEISDKAIELAFVNLVKSARSPTEATQNT